MFKDIIELSEFIKARVSLLLLLPFWYLSLFLFQTDFFNSSDLILKIVTCFCISLPAELIMYLNISNIMIRRGYEENNIKNVPDFTIFILTIWLALLIFIVYILKNRTTCHIPFYLLVLLFYFVPFLSGVFALLQKRILKLEQKEEQ